MAILFLIVLNEEQGRSPNGQLVRDTVGRKGVHPEQGVCTLPFWGHGNASGTGSSYFNRLDENESATQTVSFYFTVLDDGEHNPNGEFRLDHFGRRGAQPKR